MCIRDSTPSEHSSGEKVAQGGMKLNVATIANEGRLYEAADGEIAVKSQGQALVVLSDDRCV